MSKGKRKSVPGVYSIIQQKLRSGTLSADDRSTLHQLARLDLIDLIENELGIQLKGSQKNSVAAMIDFLLGPEGGEASGRWRPRRRPALLLKRSRRGSGEQQVAVTSAAARAAHQSGELKIHAGPAQYEPTVTANKQEASDQAAGDYSQQQYRYTAATAQNNHETEGSCPAGLNASGYSGAEHQQQQYEQGQWLRELQMQLTAAHTAGDDAEDNAALADDGISTPQSDMVLPQSCLGSPAAAAAAAGGGGGVHAADLQQQQHNWYTTLNQAPLETKLLDQLLRDMQLSTQAQHHHQQQAYLQHLHGQPTPQMVQNQPQHQLNAPQVHLIQPLQSQQQMQLQLEPSLQLPLQQHYGSSSFAAAAAKMASSGFHSCPLSGAVTTSIPGSWSIAMPALAAAPADWGDYTVYPFSTDALLQGQCQHQQSTQCVEATPGASLIKKRDRHQMTWHTAAAPAAAHGPTAAILGVELSGLPADVATKRMSFVAPGTASATAVATSTADLSGAGDSQQQFAAACSHHYMDTTADSGNEDNMEFLQQQSPQLRQRSSLKKGMKGLARRVKAFLKPGSSKHHPQVQHMPAVDAATAAAGPYSSVTAPEVFGVEHVTMTRELTVQASLAHHFSATSLPDFRLHSSTTDVGSFAANRTTSAPGAYQTTMQQTYDSTQATTHLGSSNGYAGVGAGSQQSFAERLQLLRAMYDQQDTIQHPGSAATAGGLQTAVAAAAAGGGGGGGAGVGSSPVGLVMQQQQQLLFGGMPALQEESDIAPGAHGGPKPSSPSPFLHKITKALGLNTKDTDKQEDATAALTATSSGLSLTERSNSSFSQFLATVANSWRQESSSMAAAAIPLSSDTWPSATTVAGTVLTASTRQSSCSSHSRSFMHHRSFVQGSLPSMAGNTAAAVATAGIELSSGLFEQCGVFEAAAAGIPLELSRPSVNQVLRPCSRSTSADTQTALASAAAWARPIADEPSQGSFSNLLGMCARRDTGNSAAGVAAAPCMAVEGSRGSFSHLLGVCTGSDIAARAAAASFAAAEAVATEAGLGPEVGLMSDVGSGELVPGALATACVMGLLQFDDVVMADGADK